MNAYVSMNTEIKVGTKPVLVAEGTEKIIDSDGKEVEAVKWVEAKDKDGKPIIEAVKEAISFLVPKIDFFSDIINEEITSATDKAEPQYSNAKAQWLFEAITSKARSTLTSRIETKGAITWKKPYAPWVDFDGMVKVLGQRGRVGKDALVAAFVVDFTAFLLTLGKSEKFVSDRIFVAKNEEQLAASSSASKEKFATILGEFFAILDDDGKAKHEAVFGDLMAICRPKSVPELSDE